MTNSTKADAETSRGAARRAGLVDAGIALVAESGWSGLTHRAVAAKAAANAGLVLVAAVDGLTLHLTLDPEMSLEQIVTAVRRAVSAVLRQFGADEGTVAPR